MTLARLTALAEAAVAALEAGDYADAIRNAIACKPLLAVTPELMRASAGNSQSLAFRSPDAIDSFVAECRRLQNTADAQTYGPFAQSAIRYARAGE